MYNFFVTIILLGGNAFIFGVSASAAFTFRGWREINDFLVACLILATIGAGSIVYMALLLLQLQFLSFIFLQEILTPSGIVEAMLMITVFPTTVALVIFLVGFKIRMNGDSEVMRNLTDPIPLENLRSFLVAISEYNLSQWKLKIFYLPIYSSAVILQSLIKKVIEEHKKLNRG